MLARMGVSGSGAVTEVSTPDGRTLEVLTGGAVDGFPMLLHGGQPSAAVPFGPLDQVAADRGLRLVTWSRPGYGGSTPRPAGDDTRVADDVTDTVAVLDSLDLDEFITLGWSGGGPRALACAALLPDRCRAAASLAGVAPYDAEGLDWFAGMAPENVAEYTAAAQGPEAYQEYLEREFVPVLSASADEVAAALGELVTPVDRAAITGDFAGWLSETFRRAGAQGVVGMRNDGLTVMRPWGFDLADIRVPVAIWQGRQDAMVPFAHGEWLAGHVPGARVHLLDQHGHLSLFAEIDAILDDLVGLAGIGLAQPPG